MESRPRVTGSLRRPWPTRVHGVRALPRAIGEPLRRVLGLHELERVHGSWPAGMTAAEFADAALQWLGIRLEVVPACLDAVPREGPIVFVANHPHGALDGLITISALSRVRPDLRLLANFELTSIPQLASVIFPLDPYERSGAPQRNAVSLRRALRWLDDGRAILLFPAGEVARLDVRSGRVRDRPWPAAVGRWIRLAGAPVIPLHLAGGNSAAFQLLSLLHPALGTLFLPRELLKQRGRRAELAIGPIVSPSKLNTLRTDEDRIAQLRLRVELLALKPPRRLEQAPAPDADGGAAESTPRRPARDDPSALHRAEIERLPAEALLAHSGDLRVYVARKNQIPQLLLEIGRLREQTFRAAGEGTGGQIDLDLFDNYYDQLVLWNSATAEVIGGYRIARVDEVLRSYGKRGLYTHTLFDLREPLLEKLGPALELGRAFVRCEWQRSYAPLLLLWRAIGAYVAREPRYCLLFGPVSVSRAYLPTSRDLLIDWLRASQFDARLARLVIPRQRYRRAHPQRLLDPWIARQCGVEGLSSLIEEIEPDRKGVPVLLRHYLRLGGRILGFNVDHAFCDAVDCLLWLDLRRTDRSLLRKYMSADDLQRFEAMHRPVAPGDSHRDRGLA